MPTCGPRAFPAGRGWGGALTGSPWAPGPHGSPSGRQEEGALTELPRHAQVAWVRGCLRAPQTPPAALPVNTATPGRPPEVPHAPLLPRWPGRFLRTRKNLAEGPGAGKGWHLLAMGLPGQPRFQLWGDHARDALCAGGGVAQAAAGKRVPTGDEPGWGIQVSPWTSCPASVSPSVIGRSPPWFPAHL